LTSGRSRPLDAVDPVARRREAVGLDLRSRDRQQGINDIVTDDTTGPATKQALCGRLNGEGVLLVRSPVVRNRVTSPVCPHRHAVAVQRLFVADQRTDADTRADELGNERDADFLAVAGQVGHADDRVGRVRAHEGVETGSPQEVRRDIAAEFDQFVIGVVRSEGHWPLPFC
jgi:hypothetical protein